VEVRIQFKDPTQGIFEDVGRNELVMRIQPSEAVYLKLNTKKPGLYTRAVPTEMDLTYKRRFVSDKIPEAYEALLLDALKGDHSNFVRSDELDHAWKVRAREREGEGEDAPSSSSLPPPKGCRNFWNRSLMSILRLCVCVFF